MRTTAEIESTTAPTARSRALRVGAGIVGAAGIICASAVLNSGMAAADPIDEYTPANAADYAATTADHEGWVFFRTPGGFNCAIAPNGGLSGCDAAPYDQLDVNQTVVSAYERPHMRFSDSATFTQPGGQTVLSEGYRLDNQGTSCGVGYQGTVTCVAPNGPGFTLSATYVSYF